MSDETVAKLRECFDAGMTGRRAAVVAGVHERTAQLWFADMRDPGGVIASRIKERIEAAREANDILDACPPTAPHKEWFRDAPWKRAGR